MITLFNNTILQFSATLPFLQRRLAKDERDSCTRTSHWNLIIMFRSTPRIRFLNLQTSNSSSHPNLHKNRKKIVQLAPIRTLESAGPIPYSSKVAFVSCVSCHIMISTANCKSERIAISESAGTRLPRSAPERLTPHKPRPLQPGIAKKPSNIIFVSQDRCDACSNMIIYCCGSSRRSCRLRFCL